MRKMINMNEINRVTEDDLKQATDIQTIYYDESLTVCFPYPRHDVNVTTDHPDYQSILASMYNNRWRFDGSVFVPPWEDKNDW